MASGGPAPRYDAAQRTLHWAMAAVILCAVALGVAAALLPRAELREETLMIHKSLGMTALALIVLRLPYRLAVGAPPLPGWLGRATRAGAHAVHFALYLLMVAMPLSGYVFSVAGGHAAPWFGLFEWPTLAPHDAALAHRASLVHFWLAWALGAALALHIAAAAWHGVVRRDGLFARMGPARASPQV